MPNPQYVEQEWKDAGEVGATPIWADIADAGAGPSLQKTEQGIVAAHQDALAAHVLATAAIPKPSTPGTDTVIQYNGSTYIAAKVGANNVTDASLPITKLTPGTNGQTIVIAGGVATWGTISGVPLRTIVMFHMDSGAEAIPTGWAVCNGQTILLANHDLGGGVDYVTPDLRNRFILGADPGKAVANAGGTADTSADAPGPKGVAGSQSHTISTGELPAHTHAVGTLAISPNPHDHAFSGNAYFGGSTLAPPGGYGAQYQDVGDVQPTSLSITGATASVGSGTAMDYRPRFYGLVFIMKVKNV